jgi:hypothetical protein
MASETAGWFKFINTQRERERGISHELCCLFLAMLVLNEDFEIIFGILRLYLYTRMRRRHVSAG